MWIETIDRIQQIWIKTGMQYIWEPVKIEWVTYKLIKYYWVGNKCKRVHW